MKKLFVFLQSATLVLLCAGCSTAPSHALSTVPSGKVVEDYSLTYYYCITSDEYVTETTREALDQFGKSDFSIVPSEPETQLHTDIPDLGNNAKGTYPFSVLFPELDLAKYLSCDWEDAESGLSVFGCYRTLGDMTTDEVIKVYVDSSGQIQHCETENVGKYDSLGLDESKFEALGSQFSRAATKALRPLDFYFCEAGAAQTEARVFTDSQGRLVITATIAINQEGRLIEAELYAAVNRGKRLAD